MPLNKSLCWSPGICQVSGVSPNFLTTGNTQLRVQLNQILWCLSWCLLMRQRLRRCMSDLRKMPPFKPLNDSEVHMEVEDAETQEIMGLSKRLRQDYKECPVATYRYLCFSLPQAAWLQNWRYRKVALKAHPAQWGRLSVCREWESLKIKHTDIGLIPGSPLTEYSLNPHPFDKAGLYPILMLLLCC